MTNWPRALAAGNCSAGISVGTIASNAGAKNASPAPYTATSTSSIHSCSAPVTDRTPISPIATASTALAASSSRRRSNRSLNAPPTSSSSTVGSVQATPTSASAVGTSDSA